jgi:hypothetical protein
MVIDQRNAGASVTPTNGQYVVDRWAGGLSVSSKFTMQQNAGSVTPPVGFSNYLGCTSTSAYSVTADDIFGIQQRIEGYNIADLAWGTANASPVTLSFWVRSSLTGTFGGALRNGDFNRQYTFSYTITAANTWQYKTVTIAGDTSGTWAVTNGNGIGIFFAIASGANYQNTAGSWGAGSSGLSPTGQTSVVGTNGATFYITGVQLEKGTTATNFDVLPFGTELQLCQRYFQLTETISGVATASTVFSGTPSYPVQMRASPTIGLTAVATITDLYIADFTQSSINIAISAGTRVTNKSANINLGSYTGLTQGRFMMMIPNTGASITLSAEL